MTNFGNIIYRTGIKAYIIKNGTYMVPHPEDTTVPESIHAEFDALWHEIDDYAKAYPERVTEEFSYEPTIDDIRAVYLDNLDSAQKNITGSIAEAHIAEDFSSEKAYQAIYKHNALLYGQINGAESVDELNSITILKPSPENIWEMASALVNG